MKNTFKFFFILIVTTGIIYPLVLTSVAKWLFPASYEGNLIKRNGLCIGSFSLKQNDLSERYLGVSNASCSGGDPHVSLEMALIQAPVIAKLRHEPLEKIEQLMSHFVKKKSLGFLGPVTLNSMELNVALDDM